MGDAAGAGQIERIRRIRQLPSEGDVDNDRVAARRALVVLGVRVVVLGGHHERRVDNVDGRLGEVFDGVAVDGREDLHAQRVVFAVFVISPRKLLRRNNAAKVQIK